MESEASERGDRDKERYLEKARDHQYSKTELRLTLLVLYVDICVDSAGERCNQSRDAR